MKTEVGGSMDHKETLDILQREYRNMELNRKAFQDESNIVLKRQQQSLNKLRAENESLKTDIATMKAKEALRCTPAPVANFERKAIHRIHTEMDKYSTKIEIEKNRTRHCEELIEDLKNQIWKQRQIMGGVNAERENRRLIEKQVRILENRLEQALVKYNKSVATNRSIRQVIDDLRGERLNFDSVHKKLEKELLEKTREMANVIELSNISYEHRDKAQSEIESIRGMNKREREAFEDQVVELGRILEENLREMTLRQANDHDQMRTTVSSKATTRKKSKPDQSIYKREHLHLSTEKLQNFEQAFRKIAAATGMTDVDELVEAFIENEEQNFSLFSYANEQANEIERIEEQVCALQAEQEAQKCEAGHSDEVHERMLQEIDEKIRASENQKDNHKKTCSALAESLENMKNSIRNILVKFKYKEDVNESQPTVANLLYHLGVIEEKSNGILARFHQITSSKRINETMDDSCLSSTTNLLGAGPTVSIQKEVISVNLPKINDYSSDEDSIDENEAAIKPLTLSELQQRTEARMREKNIKANEDSMITTNSGKSANRKIGSRRSSQKLLRQ